MSGVSSNFTGLANSIEAAVQKYEALALDIDGTSIRNEPIHAQFGVQTLHDYGVTVLSDGTKIDEAWWFSHLGIGHRAVYNMLIEDGQTLERMTGTGAMEHLDEDSFTTECLSRYQKFLTNVTPEQRPNLIRPGISELITAFAKAGKPVIAVSGNEATTVLANMRAIGIDNRVAHAISHSTMEEMHRPSKPAPDCYLYGAELLGVAPRSMLAIEDSKTGVRAAQAAGIDVVHILYDGQQPTSGAQYYVRDDQDLRAALDKRFENTVVEGVKVRAAMPRKAATLRLVANN